MDDSEEMYYDVIPSPTHQKEKKKPTLPTKPKLASAKPTLPAKPTTAATEPAKPKVSDIKARFEQNAR